MTSDEEARKKRLAANSRRWRQRHPERRKASERAWREKNPEKVKAATKRRNNQRIIAWRRKRRGWTDEAYEAALLSQQGKCACCGEKPNQKAALSADHCHRTGKARQLLCIRCNVAIGVLESSLRPLYEEYLRRNAT